MTVFAARVAVVLLVVSVVAVVAVALVAVAMIAVVIAIAIAARAAGDRHVGLRPSECDARPARMFPWKVEVVMVAAAWTHHVTFFNRSRRVESLDIRSGGWSAARISFLGRAH